MPGPEELSRAQLLALLSAKDEQIDALVRVGKLTAQVQALVLKLGKDSASSSKPPSSDGPDRRRRGGSSRTRSGRKPGKQAGEPVRGCARSMTRTRSSRSRLRRRVAAGHH
jgi:Family of unknown function (DUF6444)